MSRQQAKRASFNLKERTAIISINGSDEPLNNFERSDNLLGVCKVVFDDIVDDKEWGVLISDDDAEKISEFVNRLWDNIDHLIVHCFAGISRSSGCMSAILQAKEIDDSWIWNSKIFCPNTTVAKSVLKAFGIDRTKEYDKLWKELCAIPIDENEDIF